jgi:hypothetical protein
MNIVTPKTAARLDLARALRLAEACQEGLDWAARFKDCSEAFLSLNRVDWVLWSLRHAGLQDAAKERRFACWCARSTPLAGGGTVWDLLGDPRSRAAVEVAERYALGAVDGEELAAARAAAEWVTTALADGAPAVRAAAAAAAWSTAEDPTLAVVESAAAAATAAGWPEATAAQVLALRELFGNPFASAVAQWRNAAPVAPR